MGMAFCRDWTHLKGKVKDLSAEMPDYFPTPDTQNYGIAVSGPHSSFGSTPFMTAQLHMFERFDRAWFFPRWTYVQVGERQRRVDNVSEEILAHYREILHADVTTDDIFRYAYGALYDPHFRGTWETGDPRDIPPQIPDPPNVDRFAEIVALGSELGDLHRRVQSADPLDQYPLRMLLAAGADVGDPETWRVGRMEWSEDRTAIVYNSWVTLIGVPPGAERFRLGQRSIVDWIVSGYNDIPDIDALRDINLDPMFILDYIKRTVTLGVHTMRILDQMYPSYSLG